MPIAIINGTKLYYEEHGHGQPLVMIQGFAGNQFAWFFQVMAFEKHFRVITFDARGIGRSAVSKVPYTVPVMVEDVLGLMDYLKIERAHILGLSLGGLVAQVIAIDHPERVMKMVLVSTLPGTNLEYIANGVRGVGREVLNMDVIQAMGYFIKIAFNKPVYRYLIKLLSRPRLLAAYSNYFKQMQTVGEYSAVDRLQSIQAPTLVITGSNDRLVSPHCSKIIAGKIPHARLVMVKGGSHAFFLEMRGRLNREVLHFLLG
jgi:3-oxoadipate enol-lactonase